MSICFFKQKTAYEMRISDWSSDVCSSDREEATLSADRLLVVADRLDLRLDVGLRVALVPHGLHVRGQVWEQAVDLRTHGVRVAGRVVAVLAGAVVRVDRKSVV